MNNDLISREALRKNMEFICMGIMAGTEPYNAPLTEIDNAPSVDIKDQIAGAYNEGYMCGNKEAEKARPQGEWLFHRCSLCGRYDARDNENFCSNCGADMRKGGVV